MEIQVFNSMKYIIYETLDRRQMLLSDLNNIYKLAQALDTEVYWTEKNKTSLSELIGIKIKDKRMPIIENLKFLIPDIEKVNLYSIK